MFLFFCVVGVKSGGSKKIASVFGDSNTNRLILGRRLLKRKDCWLTLLPVTLPPLRPRYFLLVFLACWPGAHFTIYVLVCTPKDRIPAFLYLILAISNLFVFAGEQSMQFWKGIYREYSLIIISFTTFFFILFCFCIIF